MMDRVRFESIVSAYGGDPRRWPEAERVAAEAYAAANARELASLLREARALDGVLDADAPVAAGDLLIARVLARAPKAVARAFFEPRLWTALAACAVAGVLAGFGGGSLIPEPDESEAVITAAFRGASADLDMFEVDG
jgi:hypothetical protein